jgi:hypothetical protein
MHSDPKFGRRRGGVSNINARVPARHSSLGPSEKKLPEWHSGTFCHKNIPPISNKRLQKSFLLQKFNIVVSLSLCYVNKLKVDNISKFTEFLPEAEFVV